MDALVVLMILLGVALVAALCVLVPLLLTVRSLRRRNRVSPDHRTDAPIVWLSAPSRAARLHRRLRSATTVARMIADRSTAGGRLSRTAELAYELEAEALTIDRHLPVVARLAPRERTLALRDLAAQVAQVERLVSRLSLLEADDRAPARLGHHGTAMEELSRSLDALEAARAELRTLDAASGLDSHPTLPVPRSTPGT
jgi:hypothetical protein